MRERNRTNFVRNKKQLKTKTLYLTLFVTAMFIFSSAVSAINLSSEPKEENELKEEVTPFYPVDGLAPQTISALRAGTASKELKIGISGDGQTASQPFGENMYGYTAALGPHGEGPCYWDMEAPGDIEQLSTQTLPNFAAGGTYSCDDRWIVCEYSNGALYEIDPETGDISDGWGGSGGSGLNGLAQDPSDQSFYGCSSTDFYGIDVETGDLTYIGSFGIGDSMIGITFDEGGTCYGWDVKFSGNAKLYTIDLETGAATEKFDMGFNLLYAQDGEYNRADGLIYLSAYSGGGKLITFNPETGDSVEIGAFENGAEVTGDMIIQSCIPPEHDLALKSIDKPEDGYATNDMDVEVTVKNYGNNSEYSDVQFEIIKCEEGPALDSADFSTWLPTGWSTDYWSQSNSNYAGGIPPEAHVNKYSVGYGYDNYIMSAPVNATGFEKINVKFRLYLETYSSYGRYVYFYLQYRANDTSPWRDASPWDNPVGSDLGPEHYEIGCYGWGEDMGSEFQVRWALSGTYYYYWNDIYLDDFEIFGCAGCAEYTDLQEDVFVDFDEEVVVEFEKWTPSEWHNEEYVDTWEEYPLAAYTLLEDNNTRNNRKQMLLSIYYPFLHDVGTFNMMGPQDGPAQIFPMTGVIKNVGQYDECCFKTYAQVAEIDYSTTTNVYSYDWGTSCYPFPRDGWSISDANWRCSYTSYFGAYGPCGRFYYYPISYPKTYRYTSPAIDTSDFGAVDIQFDWRQTYSNTYGTYTMEIETSPDGSTWDTVWSTTGPQTTTASESIVTGENVGGDLYISFTVKTESYSILYWYFDNLVIDAYPLKEPEYEDEICISTIDVGEELELEFDDWTPEYLAEETTGTKTYKASIWTEMQSPPDQKGANDEYSTFLSLDFFHDVGIREVTSPYDNPEDRVFYAVDSGAGQFNWFTYEDPGTFNYISNFPSSNFPQGATFDKEAKMWVCDTYGGIWYKEDPMGTDITTVGNTGTSACNALAFHEGSGVMYGCSSSQLYEIDMDTGSATIIGSFGGGSNLMISIDSDTDGNMYGYDLNFASSALYSIDLDTGAATSIGNTGMSFNYGQDMAYDWNEEEMLATVFNYNTFYAELCSVNLETGAFTYIDTCGPQQVTCFAIPGGGVSLDTYIAPGTFSIEAIAENLGTFPETDMSCTADLYEYITDCENATFLEGWEITGIDILEPLVGEESLDFADYFFADEGFYGLMIVLTDDDDDDLGNNEFSYGIGCDDTAPSTTHSLDPPTPDGLNGWYISDVEVTVTAADPSIGCDRAGSGVDYISYEINGASGQIPGESGTFPITTDGEDVLVEYWAVDMVGNAESHNSFTIDMDQTPPTIDLTYEWEGSSPPWIFHFIAMAEDETSGMERVEFYLNEGLEKIITGPGPEYIFSLPYIPPPYALWTAIGFDFAGLQASDIVENPEHSTNLKTGGSSSDIGNTIRVPQRI